jgi:hypothetical protein
VDYVTYQEGTYSDAYCTSVVVMRNVGPNDITFQVEFFDYISGSMGYYEKVVSAGDSRNIVANNTVRSRPFTGGASALFSEFAGHATVHADDPRVHVSSYIVCRDGTGQPTNILSVSYVGGCPVGATADYFTAGMPQDRTPPTVEPR